MADNQGYIRVHNAANARDGSLGGVARRVLGVIADAANHVRVEGRPVGLNSDGVVVDLDGEMRRDRGSGALAAIDYIVAEFLTTT